MTGQQIGDQLGGVFDDDPRDVEAPSLRERAQEQLPDIGSIGVIAAARAIGIKDPQIPAPLDLRQVSRIGNETRRNGPRL